MACSKQSRKSPSRKSKDCRGERRKGNDGRMWVSKKDINGVWRWQRVPKSPRRSPMRISRSALTPSFHGGRACGSRTRADGRWTRDQLERMAIAQGIPYDGVTMDALCKVLSFEDNISPKDAMSLLAMNGPVGVNQVYDMASGAPAVYGPSAFPENQVRDPETGLPRMYGPDAFPENQVRDPETGLPRMYGPDASPSVPVAQNNSWGGFLGIPFGAKKALGANPFA